VIIKERVFTGKFHSNMSLAVETIKISKRRRQK